MNNNIDLTDKQYQRLVDLALGHWKDLNENHLLAKAYFKATVTFLRSEGYIIEREHVKQQNKGQYMSSLPIKNT